MEEYVGNSHRAREEQKSSSGAKPPMTKVTSGAVKPKQKSEISKFRDVFISEDIHNVKSYILMDVLVPSIKKAISDIVKNGIDMILYSETERRSRASSTNASKISYGSFFASGPAPKVANTSGGKSKVNAEYGDLIFTDRGDAEVVLSTMEEAINQYGSVSVYDMYDLAGVSNDNYTLQNYGWKDLHEAKVVRTVDGFVIKTPKAIIIK